MVSVNDIKIGGYNVHDNTVILGIAFWLNEKSDISLIEEFHDINAAIELKSGSKYIIFRTTEQLEKNEILEQGFRLANIVLDKLSVFENMNYKINNSMNERMMVYQENSKLVFHYNMVTVLSLRGSTSINLVDKNEKDFIKELSQQSEWNTAFRYYRMSRLSKDRYEAYRNLYLSFENILSTISKKD